MAPCGRGRGGYESRDQRSISARRCSQASQRVTPRQWHLYTVDLEPRVGSKPGKQRPCLAVQPDPFAEAGLPSTVIIPLTARLIPSAFPLRVRVPAGTAGLDRESDLLIDQILAWDNDLFRRELGVLPEPLQDDVRAALREFLDL
jgi:mRNA interferase MazF